MFTVAENTTNREESQQEERLVEPTHLIDRRLLMDGDGEKRATQDAEEDLEVVGLLAERKRQEVGHCLAALPKKVKLSIPYFIANITLGSFGAITQFKAKHGGARSGPSSPMGCLRKRGDGEAVDVAGCEDN
ncbi:hypothetical protein NL676_016699 [Syzygium grande]|nr:hypothetical protein NL676_016699 [Syzygium grande]